MLKSNLEKILGSGVIQPEEDLDSSLSENNSYPELEEDVSTNLEYKSPEEPAPKESYKTLRQMIPIIKKRLGVSIRLDHLYPICNSDEYNRDHTLAQKNDNKTTCWCVADSNIDHFIDIVKSYLLENTKKIIPENCPVRKYPALYFFRNTLIILADLYSESETAEKLIQEKKDSYTIDELSRIFSIPEETAKKLMNHDFFLPVQTNEGEKFNSASGKEVIDVYSAVKKIYASITNNENLLLAEAVKKEIKGNPLFRNEHEELAKLNTEISKIYKTMYSLSVAENPD